jgi:cytosine/adenosine deaminase-related metal-dependent hydrolase
MAPGLPAGVEIAVLPGRVIAPRSVDAHSHDPQVDAMAAWGSQLP